MGVKRENGGQTVEVATAQGRFKLQADGDFQVGERLRILLPAGGGVRLEKSVLPAGPDTQNGSWQMAGNIDVLKNLRAFEEQLVHWVARRQLGPGGPGGAPGAGPGKGGLAAALGGNEADALLRLPLPELLKRVLSREGGRDMLMQALAGLGKESFAALMAGMEEGKGGGGAAESGKGALMALLRGMRRDIEAPPGSVAGQAGAARGGSQGAELGAFWPSTGGASGGAKPGEASVQPWMGRVLERNDLGANLSLVGGKPMVLQGRGAIGGDPLYKYMLDLGGRTLEVQSAQSRAVGEFVDFDLENPGSARLGARLLDPAQAMPAGLRTAFAEASQEGKAALQVAARHLADFRGEPYFDKLVKDFGEVLSQSGRLAMPEGGSLRAGQVPGPKELDGLLRLFVAFPRDAEQPEKQAKTWSEAARDPKAMMDFLKALQPDKDTSLLRAGTPLHLARGAGLPSDWVQAGLPGAGLPGTGAGKEDVLANLLRNLLPDGIKGGEVGDLARQLAGAEARPGQAEAKAAQFMMQAFAGLVPREDEMREGKPNPFYFYHNQEWKGLNVTWERNRDTDGREKGKGEVPIKVRVETDAKHMGKVDVGLVLHKDKASLDFKNQFHDVRELLAKEMPELQRSAGLLGVQIEGWTYAQLEDQPVILPTAGWVRPASLDGGNLDMMG